MANITPTDFRDSVFQALRTFWADRTPIAWPNVKFDPATEVTGTAWLEVQLLGAADGEQIKGSSVKGQPRQRNGTVALSIYVRGNTATDEAYSLVDAALLFLEDMQKIPNTLLTARSQEEVGPDGVWYQINVSASYSYFTDRA